MSAIHATAIVEPGAKLGKDVKIGPYCAVGPEVVLGDRVELLSHVVVEGKTSLGADCKAHPFVCLGGPPQHTGYRGEDVELVIGERTVMREHVTMNAGSPFGRGRTIVGSDGYFMIASHVAHDCLVGNHVTFANNAVIGGHVEIGNYVTLGGNCAVHQRARIGDYAMVGGMSGLENDLIPYGSCVGDRADLAGLNVVGLKRNGFDKAAIQEIREAYKALFAPEGTLAERVEKLAQDYAGSPVVMAIVAFIKAERHRRLCTPRARGGMQANADATA